jgi:hypothetical protein
MKTDRKVLSSSNNRFLRIFLAETLGTFLLVLLGDAAVAQVPTFLFFLLVLMFNVHARRMVPMRFRT